MPNCIYIYKGHTFKSEQELDDFLLQGKDKLHSKYGDIVFQNELQNITNRQLETIAAESAVLQEKYKEAKKHPTYIDGEEELHYDFPYIGVTSFLRGLTNSDDKLLTPEFREFEYWIRRIKDWKDPDKGFNEDEEELFGSFSAITDSLTENELRQFLKKYEENPNITTNNQVLSLILQMKNKWKAQGEMGTAIHNVLKELFSPYSKTAKKAGMLRVDDNTEQLLNLFFKDGSHYNTNYLTKDHVRNIIEYAKNLKAQLEQKLGSDLTFYPEFQISTKLAEEVPEKGDTVLGIIDLLIVDSEGNAHVLDYKASPKDSFNSAKERGFWYQLGLYNKMLQVNNVKTSSNNYQVMVAPIKMNNFRKEGDKFVMGEINARNGEYLIDITANSTLGDVAKNLEEFVPKKPLVNYTPEEIITKMTQFGSTVFPEISTTKTWDDENIQKLIDSNGGIEFDSKTNRYSITINGIKPFSGDTEAEVIASIKKYYQEILPTKRKDIVHHTLLALRKGIKENTTNIDLPKIGLIDSKSGASAEWFKNTVSKYCNSHHKIIENPILEEFGVILIENVDTKQVNVLKVTTDDLDFKHYFDKNKTRRLITGGVESDRVQSRKPNSLALEADNGNVHLMETMAILNCIPGLLEGVTIGEVLVANPHQLQGRSASNEELKYNFNELASHIKDYQNNLKDVRFASMVDLASNRLKQIMAVGESSNWADQRYANFRQFTSIRSSLDSAISAEDERKILGQLEELRKQLEQKFSIDISLEIDSYDENANLARSLYNKVMLAIAETKGISFRQQTRDNAKYLESMEVFRNGVQSLMLDNPGNLDNDTLNNLTKLVSEAYQNVREDMQREMGYIRELVENLKSDKNFSKIIEMTGGNAANLFKNMIEYKDGDILFKNPWSNTFSGSSAERKFLEYALTKINANRFQNKEEDAEIMRTSRDPRYYRVPLIIGDTASQAAVLGSMSKTLKKRLERLKPKVWWEELQKKLTGVFTDVDTVSDDQKIYEMTNMFERGEKNVVERKELIQQYGVDYFEHNLETLLLKHIFAYSSKKHIDMVMPMAKASMIHLITQGHLTNKKYVNATNYVSDYIKNKIRNESLIPENMRNFDAIMGQIKSAASFLMLGFSPVQYGYQLVQGLWTDIRLMIQGRGEEDTPFTFENFKFAFGQVYKDMFKLGGKPTKCSLLNEYFGMNDMDMNTYADKIKSDRYGIFNISNIAFHCTSRPDFFNRMSIFVAQMKQDGVWDAYTVDSKNRLKYNWKNDKRFDVYALGEKEGMAKDPVKYKEQRGLYYAIAEQLEKEHALNADGTYFKFGQDLPKAYTNQQMESYKALSDDIYGYYTHEKKAMIHAHTLGSLWMQMRTFWSGKKNQYLGASGVKLKGKYVHKKDADGNLLYYKEENGKMIPQSEENTGVPVVQWEGQWQEGIFLTLRNIIKDSTENGFKTTFDDMWDNPENMVQRQNIKQLVYDMAMFLMIGPLLVGMMQDWDDELNDEVKTVDDAAIATAAHMAMKMVSSSFGDFNFIESIGSPLVSWEPFSFSYMRRRFEDIVDVAMGDKDFTKALLNISGVTSTTKVFWETLLEQ